MSQDNKKNQNTGHTGLNSHSEKSAGHKKYDGQQTSQDKGSKSVTGSGFGEKSEKKAGQSKLGEHYGKHNRTDAANDDTADNK